MKYIVILSILWLACHTTSVAQALPKHVASVQIGVGTFEDISLSRTYGLSFGKHLKSGVYAVAGWTQAQGSTSLTSTIGDLPPIEDILVAQFVNVPEIKSDIISNTTLSLGLSKVIQLGDKLHMQGSLSIARSTTRRQYVGGIPPDPSTIQFLDELYPVFEQYSNIGASVGLTGMYFLREHMALSIGLNYLSAPTVYDLRIGASTWF